MLAPNKFLNISFSETAGLEAQTLPVSYLIKLNQSNKNCTILLISKVCQTAYKWKLASTKCSIKRQCCIL